MTETVSGTGQAGRTRQEGSEDRPGLLDRGCAPLRRAHLGATRRRPDQLEDRRGRLRAARRRVPRHLERQRLHDRHHQVLPRRRRHRRPRVEPQAADRPRREDLPQGRRGQRLLRVSGRRRAVRARADLAAGQPVLLVQLPGLVQRRHRLSPAGVRVLHPLRRRLDELDPELVQGRGLHLQGRLRRRPEPLPHPLLQGAALQRRYGERPGLLHARCRRLRGHHQVRRRHASCGEDGRPRRRPPRHRRVRRDQGEGRGQDPRPA